MPKFRAHVHQRTVFPTVQRRNGSTLEADPGEVVDLEADPHHPLLVAVVEEKKPAKDAAGD